MAACLDTREPCASFGGIGRDNGRRRSKRRRLACAGRCRGAYEDPTRRDVEVVQGESGVQEKSGIMKKSQYKSLCALIAGVGVASAIACSEGPTEFGLDDSSIDVGETTQEAVKALPKAYPVAIGHDQIFYSDGQRKDATLANVLVAQSELTAKLLFDADPDVQAVFEEMEAAAAPVKGAQGPQKRRRSRSRTRLISLTS